MPDIPSDVWLSIGSAIGAALLLFVTRAVVDWMKDRRALEREREARAARRNDEDRIRHLSSQLEILTELQKAVDEFGRTAAMMSNANRRAYKDTGEWKKNVYGHELDQRAHQSERRTLLLGAQVDNAEVRRLLKEMQHWWWGVPLAATREESENAFAQVQRVGALLNERVGLTLRQLHTGVRT